MPRGLLSALPIVLALGLTSCGGVASGAESVEALGPSPGGPEVPEVIQESELAPWEGPSDGTWDYGEIGYMQTYEPRVSDYRVTLLGLPSFGPLVDGRVEVSSKFSVERFQDRGYGGTVGDDLRFGFHPGNYDWEKHQENYAVDLPATCLDMVIPVGETRECVVSFNAPVDEIQDFSWWISGRRVAAWPSQTV